MRALHFDGQSVQLSKNYPDPEQNLGTEQALVRVIKAGVSSTDVQVAQGMFNFTGILGHEFVGVVEQVNQGDTSIIGKKIVGSMASRCGTCDLCQSGLQQHCRHRTMPGLHGRDGCFADRIVLPMDMLNVVPEGVDDDRAVFGNLVSAALQARRQLTIEGKPYITILGDGPLAMVVAQVMVKLNASVRVIGRYSEKLAICEKWGVKHRHIDDIGRRADQDVVVECTGSLDGFNIACQLVRPRGTIILKSLLADWHHQKAGTDLTRVVMNQITVIGSAGGSIGEALGAIQREEIDVVSLISRRMSLNDGQAILQAAQQPGTFRVLVDI
ncbi:MAG: alcohol dehydrogenase catalytic domain-containing protein [Planctomycetota bacterium]|nr:alcohol dehydrogenase catalytic domain-containing protein [Planctomycetota bacterium]